MTKFNGHCYGGPCNGEIVTSREREWRTPVPKPRPVRAMAMWDGGSVSMETYETVTYRVDRVIEAATSKRGTAMFRELTFFLCDGHNLTTFERSQILTDLRWTGWQCRRATSDHWGMSSREYDRWQDEVQSWGYREVILANLRGVPIEWGPYVQIESLLDYGPALPPGFLVKI